MRDNPEVFIAVGAMTLGIIIAAVCSVWIENRDRIRFSRRLVKDPEVGVVRDMVRLEGSGEVLHTALRDWEAGMRDSELGLTEEKALEKKLDRALTATINALQAVGGLTGA